MDTPRTVSPGTGLAQRLDALEERLGDLEDALGEVQDVLEALVNKVGLPPLEESLDTLELQEKH